MAANADKPPDDWYSKEEEIQTNNQRSSSCVFQRIGAKALEARKSQVEKQLKSPSASPTKTRKSSLLHVVEQAQSNSRKSYVTLPRSFSPSRFSSKNESEIKPPKIHLYEKDESL